eukprot:827551-Pleurochrysis_carterae.AAC.1
MPHVVNNTSGSGAWLLCAGAPKSMNGVCVCLYVLRRGSSREAKDAAAARNEVERRWMVHSLFDFFFVMRILSGVQTRIRVSDELLQFLFVGIPSGER